MIHGYHSSVGIPSSHGKPTGPWNPPLTAERGDCNDILSIFKSIGRLNFLLNCHRMNATNLTVDWSILIQLTGWYHQTQKTWWPLYFSQLNIINCSRYKRSSRISPVFLNKLMLNIYKWKYHQTSSLIRTQSQHLKVFVSSCSFAFPVHWLSPERRYIWSSSDGRCSNFVWVINNFIYY